MSDVTYERLSRVPELTRKNLPHIFSYNYEHPIEITGKFSATVEINSMSLTTECFVTKGATNLVIA